MRFARFFIDRPIFAAVLSIIILTAGAIAIPLLPVSEYPEVVPPTIVVRATYPGANPKTIAEVRRILLLHLAAEPPPPVEPPIPAPRGRHRA